MQKSISKSVRIDIGKSFTNAQVVIPTEPLLVRPPVSGRMLISLRGDMPQLETGD